VSLIGAGKSPVIRSLLIVDSERPVSFLTPCAVKNVGGFSDVAWAVEIDSDIPEYSGFVFSVFIKYSNKVDY
jgi:hypothetical protein